MNISNSLAESLRDRLFEETTRFNPDVASLLLYYNEHKIFTRFLEITVPDDGECFIPIVAMGDIHNCIKYWVTADSEASSMKLSIPLYIGGTTERKTAEPLIKTICRCTVAQRLLSVYTSSGLSYYGGNGLLFDKQWKPLMMCGYMVNVSKEDNSCAINRPICYVSPEVFSNDDFLSKVIIKKVIPFLGIYGIYRYSLNASGGFGGTIGYCRVETVVRNFDSYFTTPSPVKNYENVNESIWKFLDTQKEKLYDNAGILRELVESH